MALEMKKNGSSNEKHVKHFQLNRLPLQMITEVMKHVCGEKLVLGFLNISSTLFEAVTNIFKSKRSLKVELEEANMEKYLANIKRLKNRNALDSIEEARVIFSTGYCNYDYSKEMTLLGPKGKFN